MFSELHAPKEGEEENAEEGKKDKKNKVKKKVQIALPDKIQVIKQKRGGKKVVCTIVGLGPFVPKLEDTVKLMSKKFATGVSIVDDDKYGPGCVQVQGDCLDKFFEFVETDLEKYGVTEDKIESEAGGF